jgi:hypothetical protein
VSDLGDRALNFALNFLRKNIMCKLKFLFGLDVDLLQRVTHYLKDMDS